MQGNFYCIAFYNSSDTVPHYNITNVQQVLNYTRFMANMLRTAFTNTMVLPTLGNVDFWPTNWAPYDTTLFYSQVANEWIDFLNVEALQTFVKGGYYSV